MGLNKYRFTSDKQKTHAGVMSPRKGHTLTQLRSLKSMGWNNADTGTEISESEGEDYLMRMEERHADKKLSGYLKVLNGGRSRSRGREWIPPGQVIFRNINGHVVPFRKKDEPFL